MIRIAPSGPFAKPSDYAELSGITMPAVLATDGTAMRMIGIGAVDGVSAANAVDTVVFDAAEDGSDDWGRLASLLAAEYAANGPQRIVRMRRGNYRCRSHFFLPRTLRAVIEPGSDLDVDVSPRAAPDPTGYWGPFIATFVIADPLQVSSFAANTSEGDVIVSVVSNVRPQVGWIMAVGQTGAGGEGFEVTDVSGASSPYSVRLDHGIGWPYTTAASVGFLLPNRISIAGNGCTVHGPAERYLSVAAAWDTVICGFNIDAAGSNEYACSIDSCSSRSLFADVHVRNSPVLGMTLEYGYNNLIANCTASNCGTLFGLWGRAQRLARCSGTGGTTPNNLGISIGHSFTDIGDSTRDCVVEDCQISGAVFGLSTSGALNCQLSKVSLLDCKSGIVAGRTIGSLTPTRNLVLNSCVVTSATSTGLQIVNGGSVVLNDCSFRGCASATLGGTIEVQQNSSASICGGSFVAGQGASAISCRVLGKLTASDATFDMSAVTGTSFALYGLGSARIVLDRVTFAGNPSYCVQMDGGTLWSSNVAIANTPATGVGCAAGAYYWRGVNSSFAGCTNPVAAAVLSNARANFGKTALNGATPVSIPFAAVSAANNARGVRATPAGTSGYWSLAVNPGVGLTLTGTAGDTSVIAWDVD